MDAPGKYSATEIFELIEVLLKWRRSKARTCRDGTTSLSRFLDRTGVKVLVIIIVRTADRFALDQYPLAA